MQQSFLLPAEFNSDDAKVIARKYGFAVQMPYVAHLAQKLWRQEKERKQFLHTFHKTKAEDGEEVESTVKKIMYVHTDVRSAEKSS